MDGAWLFVAPSNTSAVAFVMEDGQYGHQVMTLDETGAGILSQAQRGTLTTTSDVITFFPAESSCPGRHPAWQSSYKVTGDTMAIVDASGAFVFARTAPGNGTVSIVFGCFASDGTFTPSPLVPVTP